MRTHRFCLCLALLLSSFPAAAERPMIGLALAGGGAKGSAHIAVLEALEANNIPVDYIAGTSIGAYVGGLYALGYKAAEIKTIMYGSDLNRGYSDAIGREALTYRVKQQKDRFNVPLEIGFRDGEIRLPGGLLYGQTMSGIYRSSIGNSINLDSFDDLAIPFRAIATDLTTSDVVVIDSGNLVEAMQASATVPGALVPIEIDGRLLVDGGMSQSIPIAQVKQMGADIVIAVDISAPLLSRQELNNSIAVLKQVTTFLTIQNINEQKLLLGERDIYIRPDVDDLSSTDFSILPQAYNAGRVEVQKQIGVLRALSLDEADYRAYSQEIEIKKADLRKAEAQPVVRIVLINNSSFSDEYLLDVIGFSEGLVIPTRALIAAIDRLYSLNRFERVDAGFEQRPEGRVLVIETREKSWGPNFFEMGLSWEDDFTLDSIVNLDFAYTMGEITGNDGEWRNEIGLGTNKRFSTEFYLPLDRAHLYYNRSLYEFRRDSRDFFIDNQRAVILEFISNRVDLGLGYNFGRSGILEAGFTFERGEISNELALQDGLEYESAGIYLKAGYDTLDQLSFPTRGRRILLSLTHREEDVNGELITGGNSTEEIYNTTQYQAEWREAASRGDHGLLAKIALTYLESETDQSIYFEQLGGFLNLSGFHKNALVGNNKAFGALAYQYDLGRSLLGLKDFPLYIGASVEAGNVWLKSESADASDFIYAGSIFVGTSTKLGPVALGIGFAEGDNNSIYFYLGKNI